MLGMRKKKWLRGGGAYKREMREGGEMGRKEGGREREGEKVRRKGRQGHRETERETL